MKIGIFCYKLHGVGPRNRTKNLVHGLGKYTDHKVVLITNDKVNFNYDNVYINLFNFRNIKNATMLLKDVDIFHVPVNFYQSLFIRSVYNGPLVVGTGIQYDWFHTNLLRELVKPAYVIEPLPGGVIRRTMQGLKSVCIYPAVDTEVFRPYSDEEITKIKEKLNIPLTASVVLYVGRLEKFKGADIFYELIKMLNNKRNNLFFVVIGDGELRYLFESLNRDNVLYLGFVRNDDLPKYYNVADVTVVPSKDESFSFVSLESAACGTPVVTTARGGIERIFRKKQIYLWANRDAPSIAEKVNMLLDDQKLYRKQVKKALEFIEAEGLTLDRFVKKHVDVYKKAIEEFNECKK